MRWQSLIALLVLAGGAASANGAQIAPPVIQWQKTFGGTNQDAATIVRQTTDGGYCIGGISRSPESGNKTSPHYGSVDFWVLRLDASGNKVWERCLGGSGDDWLFDLQVTGDGGCVVVGEAGLWSVTNEVKTGTSFGAADYWLIRLDTNGSKLWDQTYGTPQTDGAFSVQLAGEDGYVVGGYSYSMPGGNRTATNYGSFDYWVVRTDTQGNIVWDRSFGCSEGDSAYAVAQTPDGGFLIAGDAGSKVDGNKTSTALGLSDLWTIRLNASGSKTWEGTYGGSDYDRRPKVIPTVDGGFFLAGTSRSPQGPTKSALYFGPAGNFSDPSLADYWIVKVDSSGNRVWDRSFGGSLGEMLWDARLTSDGGVLLCGMTDSSNDGNKMVPTFGGRDGWIVRLDSDGNRLWELALGGSGTDALLSAQQTQDGGFVLVGWSASTTGGNKVAPSYGGGDLWVIKLGPDALTAPQVRVMAQSAESIRTNGFRLEVQPPPNAPTTAFYILEASTNLTIWETIQTNQPSPGASAVEFVDPVATNRPSRFYRARMER